MTTISYLFLERPSKDVELLIKHLTGKKRLVPKRPGTGGILYTIDATALRGLDTYFRGHRRVEKEVMGMKTWTYVRSRA